MGSICMLKIAERLVSENIAKPSEIKGCSAEEIEALEKTVKLSLPKAYKDFLTLMGHGAGNFKQGTEIFYNDIGELRESAEYLLDANDNPFKLPPDAFVFSMHHGIIFH